jgi:hypothetical protein
VVEMGVEEIQRVNALARELMKHGIAGTSDEALLRAEEMLRGNGVNSMTAAITASAPGKSESHLSQEALQDLNMGIRSLGVRFDSIAKEVLGMKDEVRKLTGNLGDMERQINRMSAFQPQQVQVERHVEAPVAPVQQSFVREAVSQTAPVVAAAAQPQFVARVSTASKPAREEFKPEDVAIEKIFYFGK